MNKSKQYVNMLAGTDEQTLNKIAEYEKEGKFNDHLDTNPAPYIPVTKDYKYLPKGIFAKTKRVFQTAFVINPFCRETNKLFATEVVGKENLKGIKSAIVVCNHINKLDCMAVKYALSPRKTYFTAAEFNNMSGFVGETMRAGRMLPMSSNLQAQKNFLSTTKRILKSNNMEGFLGDMMRAGGLLPMSTNFGAQKNFLKTTEQLLRGKNFITFFPERAEWWCYEKPRPQFDGAYKVAVQNNVPVLPVFITFRGTEESRKSPTGIKQFVVNILKPIYPSTKLTAKENVKVMKANCDEQWWQTYENFYHKKREQL